VLGQDVDDEDVFYLLEEYSKRRSSSRTKEEDHGDAGHPHPRHSMNTTNNFVDFMNLFATKLSLLTEPPQVDEFVLLHDAAAAAPSKTHVPSSSSSSSGVFCVNAQLCVRPELRDEFLAIVAALKRHADDPDDEPLCIQFTYGESIHTPNTIHLHEQYIGANGGLQGFQAHEASPHLEPCRKFMATRHPAFTKPPVMQKYYRRLLLPPVAAAALLSPL
jgi:quinol monooxygenase YgiN